MKFPTITVTEMNTIRSGSEKVRRQPPSSTFECGVINAQLDAGCREMAGSEYFLSCCDTVELLEIAEEELGPVTHAEKSTAEGMGSGSSFAVGDDRNGTLDHRPDLFHVVGLVGEHEAVRRQLMVEKMPVQKPIVL